MVELFVRLSRWIGKAAVRRAYVLGGRRIDDFRRHQPGVFERAIAERKQALGFYERPNGDIDTNYHLFDNIYEAAEWAVSSPGVRAKRLFYPPWTDSPE
jgi:hypothetical protein